MAKPKSLILITVDCLRADHVGFLGYEHPTTPFLDRLAGGSVVSAAMVAGAPTYYSFPAIHAARYPLAMGRDVLGVAPGEATLASTLKAAGYATAAFSAANPYLSARFGYDQGFDVFEDFLTGESSAIDGGPAVAKAANGQGSRLNRALQRWSHDVPVLGRIYESVYFEYCQRWGTPRPESMDALRRFPSADVLVDRALSWLKSAADPFFLWLHLMDPHAPYYPKPEAVAAMGLQEISALDARYINSYWNRADLSPRGLERFRERIVGLYDAGIRWMDSQVERLVRGVEQLGRWEQCAFALTADHGEEFLEHGGRFHLPSRSGEEILRVPLLIRVPTGGAESAVSNADGKKLAAAPSPRLAPLSLLHLAPTLLDAVGVAGVRLQGRSHWREIQAGVEWSEPAIAESVGECTNPFRRNNRFGSRLLVVREKNLKLVLHLATGNEELYDLQADPGGKTPLPREAGKADRRRLLEAAREHVRGSYSNRDVKSSLRAELRDLQVEFAPAITGAPE